MSNDELSQLAMEYQNGKIVRSDSQISSALELAVLVNRLDNLTKVIQEKPKQISNWVKLHKVQWKL